MCPLGHYLLTKITLEAAEELDENKEGCRYPALNVQSSRTHYGIVTQYAVGDIGHDWFK